MPQNHQVEMPPRLTRPIPVVTKQQGSDHNQPRGLAHDKGNAQPWLPYQGYANKLGCCGKAVSRALKGTPAPQIRG